MRAAAGVARDVRQRLLRDPVRRGLDRAGQRPPRPVDAELDREAGGAAARHQLVDVGQGGRRPAGRTLRSGAQHVDEGAQLVERVLARRLDRAERALGQLRSLVDQVERGPGLHVDQRQVVRDHVVELARDAQLLVAGAQPFLLFPGAPALDGALAPDAHDLRGGREHEQPRRRARVRRPTTARHRCRGAAAATGT